MARFTIDETKLGSGNVVVLSNNETTATFIRQGDEVTFVLVNDDETPFIERTLGMVSVTLGVHSSTQREIRSVI